MSRFKNDVDQALHVSLGFTLRPNTEDEINAAVRTVCGSRSCQGASDARLLLDALGIQLSPGAMQSA